MKKVLKGEKQIEQAAEKQKKKTPGRKISGPKTDKSWSIETIRYQDRQTKAIGTRRQVGKARTKKTNR